MLLGVGGSWWFVTDFVADTLPKGCTVPQRTPHTLVVGAVFEITKGTRVLTHSSNAILNAALRVAISCFQCIRVVMALLVSAINTDD